MKNLHVCPCQPLYSSIKGISVLARENRELLLCWIIDLYWWHPSHKPTCQIQLIRKTEQTWGSGSFIPWRSAVSALDKFIWTSVTVCALRLRCCLLSTMACIGMTSPILTESFNNLILSCCFLFSVLVCMERKNVFVHRCVLSIDLHELPLLIELRDLRSCPLSLRHSDAHTKPLCVEIKPQQDKNPCLRATWKIINSKKST